MSDGDRLFMDTEGTVKVKTHDGRVLAATDQRYVVASETELAEAVAAVLRGTNLVPLDEAEEQGRILARRIVQRLHEKQSRIPV